VKGVWIALVLASIAIGFLIVRNVGLSRELEEQQPKILQFDRECYFVRKTLEETRRFLWSDDEEQRRWGDEAFTRLMRNEWHEINVCAPEGMHVGGGCGSDRDCMLHKLDWALGVVR
jgi:hypothetical protein